jgi:dihydrofolate reductase
MSTNLRKLIVTEYVTVDGIVDGFDKWFFQFWDDEIGKVKHAEMFDSDLLLFGRVTYQMFMAQWLPRRTDETGFADRLHHVAKYVVSANLDRAEWNNSTIIKANVADEVAKLKQQPGQDILVAGSPTLVETLRQHDLVDEYRLMTFPILWGKGRRLFHDGDTANLKLVDVKTFKSGVVNLIYRSAK